MNRCNAAGPILLALLALTSGCGRKQPKPGPPRGQVVATKKLSSDISPSLVFDGQTGALLVIAYRSDNFASATEPEPHLKIWRRKADGEDWELLRAVETMKSYGVWGHDLLHAGAALHFAWVDFAHRRKRVLLTKSSDGAQSWSTPVEVNPKQPGQRHDPSLAADAEKLYCAWLSEAGAGAPRQVLMASSADGGTTWSAPIDVGADPAVQGKSLGRPHLVAAAGGGVHCIFTGLWRDSKRKRAGTLSFVSLDAALQPRSRAYLFRKRVVGDADIAASPRDAKTLYIAANIVTNATVTGKRPNIKNRMYVLKSTDGGASWGEPLLVDDAEGNKSHPRIRVGNKHVVVIWDDVARGGLYITTSQDGGKTWSANVPVAGRSVVGTTDFDFRVDGDIVYLVWSSVEKGSGDALHFVRIDLSQRPANR